jgi:hypothetical protein
MQIFIGVYEITHFFEKLVDLYELGIAVVDMRRLGG